MPLKNSRTLFLIALMPDREVSNEVRMLKERLMDEFGLKAALRSPAHITLVPPFTCTDEQAEKVVDTLWKALREEAAITFGLNGTDHFDDRVIYLPVTEPADVQKIHVAVNEALRAHHSWALRTEETPFTPHITLANRDLKPEQFNEVWAKLRGIAYQRHCAVRNIHLLRHDGARWKVWKEVPLGPVTASGAT